MSVESNSRKPFPMRRVLLALFAILVLAALGLFGYGWFQADRAEKKLIELIEQLDRDDPGWRLADIEASRSDVPDAENGALVAEAVYRQLPEKWSPASLREEVNKGDANERLDEQGMKALMRELQPVEALLPEARRLAGFERGRYGEDYTTYPLSSLPPHWGRISALTDLLQFDTLRAVEQRAYMRAVENCKALAGLATTLGDEPLAYSILERYYPVMVACRMSERILGHDTIPAAELLALQRLFEKEDSWDGLSRAIRGERAIFHNVYEGIEKGEIDRSHRLGNRRPFRWLPYQEGTDLREHHAIALDFLNRHVELSRTPIAKRPALWQQIRASQSPIPDHHLLLPRTNSLFTAQFDDAGRHVELHCAIALLASERFRLKKGRLPSSIEDLKDLAPKEALIDPCDGQLLRLQLRRNPDRVVIYSVSLNGRDDGGIEDQLPKNLGITVRLWDVADRNQPAKPPPPQFPGGPGGGPPLDWPQEESSFRP